MKKDLNPFLLLLLLLLLAHCGTTVPTERKITKSETIIGEPKKVFLTENSEKVKERIVINKYLDAETYFYQIKIREHFKIPEAIMREDIARVYVTEKKKGTMVHNPLGEGTGSIFAFGMIEAWCLTEWLATSLPGKQQNIYLDKCKERYVGSKKKTTEDTVTKNILNYTGKFKQSYQDLDLATIKYSFSKNPKKTYEIEYKLKPICNNDKLKVFNCGKYFEISSKELIKNYINVFTEKNIEYPINVKIKASEIKEEISIPKNEGEKLLSIVLTEIKVEKENIKIAKLKKDTEDKRKELELKEKYKPTVAWNGSAFFVSASGHIITNNHVVEDSSIKEISGKCDNVNVYLNNKKYVAKIIAQDRQNDLALLKINNESKIKNFATFRNKEPVLGEKITALGYPFGKAISSQIKLTSGNVSSLSGIGDEFTRMQIDAALQPGNSGGPIYDKSGNVIGVAVAKASIFYFLQAFGTLPENMNFGIKSSVVKTFLQSNSVKVKIGNSRRNLDTEDIAKIGSSQTLYLECMIRKDKLAKINKIKEKRKSN